MTNLFTRFTMLSALAGLLFAGCAGDAADGARGGSGTVDIEFSASADVVSVAATRATIPGITAPANNQFSLRIVRDGANPETSPFWADITGYPVDTKHEVGDYTAIALYGDVNTEGFDKPAFGAEAPFTVEHNTEVEVPLVARLMNAALTVEYTDAFKGYFSDYSVTVLRGGAEVAEFASDQTRTLFLKPQPFTLKVEYTHRSNGKTGSFTYDIEDHIDDPVAACTHYKVALDVNEGHVGGGVIEVIFDDEVTEIQLDPIDVGEVE